MLILVIAQVIDVISGPSVLKKQFQRFPHEMIFGEKRRQPACASVSVAGTRIHAKA
jgi:hypothetical protein